MNTNEINSDVAGSRKLFTAILKDYLSGEIRQYHGEILSDPKNHSEHAVKRAKFLTKEKSTTLDHIEHQPESKWTDHDWLQCVNIFDLFYLAHRKNPVLKGTNGLEARINPEVMKAHLKYCCRYYLRENKKEPHEDGLEVLHKLFNDNKINVILLKQFNPLLQ